MKTDSRGQSAVEFDPVLVHEWLERAARRHPEKTALICGKVRCTYSQLNAESAALAGALTRLGLSRNDRAVIFMPTCNEVVTGLYATLKAGAAFVIVNGAVKADKLRYVVENSGARVILAHTDRAAVVSKTLAQMPTAPPVVWAGDPAKIPPESHAMSWEEAVATDCMPEARRIIDVDLAALIYTSGSTGEPKGVMSTHHNMISAARSIIQYVGNREDDIILNVLPLSFDYGLYQVIMSVCFGGTVVLEPSFVYLHNVLRRIAEKKVTGFPIVPTILAMLLNLEDPGRYDFSSLRYITNTGAALPPEHIRIFHTLFPGIEIFSMFGLTECKRVSYLPPQDVDRKPDSVGTAMPNCETCIVDKDGRPVPSGQAGELVIRGSNVMQGYWRDPEMTGRTYRPGRYPADRQLYSGDQFREDEDGFLYFIGRQDDMLKCKGERVSPKEVENVLCRMPGIVEAAVIGIPDATLGQAILAVISVRPDQAVTERDVLKHCTLHMENFMVPSHIEFRDQLPRTPHGKIDKKQLAQERCQKKNPS